MLIALIPRRISPPSLCKQVDKAANLGREMTTGWIHSADWRTGNRVSFENWNETARTEVVTDEKRGELANAVAGESRIAKRLCIAGAEAAMYRQGAVVR